MDSPLDAASNANFCIGTDSECLHKTITYWAGMQRLSKLSQVFFDFKKSRNIWELQFYETFYHLGWKDNFPAKMTSQKRNG